MSLRVYLSDIKEGVCFYYPTSGGKFERPVTIAVYSLCETIALNLKTDEDIKEFWWRLQFLRFAMNQSAINFSDKEKIAAGISCHPCEPTYNDIAMHKGLVTNVIILRRAHWLHKIIVGIEMKSLKIGENKYPVLEDEVTDFTNARIKYNLAWEKSKEK